MWSCLHHLETALFPRRCAACGTPLDTAERHWCMGCAFGWVRHASNGLQRFGGRLDWTFGWSWLTLQAQEQRSLVHALKYRGDPALGVHLGRWMAKEWRATPSGSAVIDPQWMLVPVPLHRKRQRRRGYNQSAQLALGWSEETGMPIAPLCIRSRAGRSLTRYNRSQRMARRNNPFSWNDAAPPPTPTAQGLIVIDDVVTTGSTLESMHRTLRTNWSGPLAFITLADAAR